MSARADTARSSARVRQLQALHRAALEISGDLELQALLRTILRTAARLVQARYGALGVPEDGGGFRTFVTVGVSDRRAALIGGLPRLHGILGALLREGKPIRLDDIRRDPRFSGYPAHHPVLREFLGMPIRHRREVLGNLYLSGSRAGRFTVDDEQIVEMLAAHAALAIITARRHADDRVLAVRAERDRITLALQQVLSQTHPPEAAAPPPIRARKDGGRPNPSLTSRERAVLDLMVGGLANKEIAQRLYVSEKTAKTHVSNILRKLGVSDRTQAAVFAVRSGLLD